MVCRRLRERGERVSPDEVDEALREFWRGSARPINRLAGVSGDECPRLGELLHLLLDCAVTVQPARSYESK